MSLTKRSLGLSGVLITETGFGAWALGGGGWAYGWGPQDDNESIQTIRHALEQGVNWIDTAAVYGLGHSEEVVGRLLRELPDTAFESLRMYTICRMLARWWRMESMSSRIAFEMLTLTTL